MLTWRRVATTEGVGMDGKLAVSALAILASTATAIVSMFVTSRAQRSAIREQYLWEERTKTYLGLVAWIEKIQSWSIRRLRVLPPSLDRDTELKASLFSSPFALNDLLGMRQVVEETKQAAQDGEWDKFHDLQWQLGKGWAVDLRNLLRDEIRGRPNEDLATQNNEIRLKRRRLLAFRWFLFKQRFRRKPNGGKEIPPDDETFPGGRSYRPG